MKKEEKNDLFRGTGIEVDIKTPDNFLKIKETLTRIGVSDNVDKKLYPICVILHKKDKDKNSHYAIEHFKELFILDGKEIKIEPEDVSKRNAITRLLEEWNLVDILKPELVQDVAEISSMKILSHKDKKDWTIIELYKVGVKTNGS